jgi:hypothetical protein
MADRKSGRKDEDLGYQGSAILLSDRVEAVEKQQAEPEQRDDEYKQDQLKVNKWMMRFT